MRCGRWIGVLLFAACSPPSVVQPPAGGGKDAGDTGGGGANHPPELHKIGDKVVQVGKALAIQPEASDPDGDALHWSIYGKLPAGAAFSEDPPRFDWTPKSVGQVVSLTFAVSDGVDLDRETVQITVVSETANHPPILQKVGDQAIEAGTSYSLQLQASDLDGDPLTFGSEGGLPDGSSLEPKVGRFDWAPTASRVGLQPVVRFTASDGSAKATLDVHFFVVAPGQNKPPTFSPLGPQVATVGKPYSLTVLAIDPDGDALTYALDGEPPQGAAFDPGSHTLSWEPLGSQGDKVFSLTFSASDGKYTTLLDVDVQVVTGIVTPGVCEDDAFEPNNDAAHAAGLTSGTYALSICDTALSKLDEDWFAVPLVLGQTLSLTAQFKTSGGDIDLAVYKVDNPKAAVAVADSADDDEVLSYPVTEPGTYLIRIFGVAQQKYANPYTLILSTAGVSCEDDTYEPNDAFSGTSTIVTNALIEGLTYCPGDLDLYQVPVTCGQSLTATIGFKSGEGNLDLLLYRAADPSKPVASSTSTSSTEVVTWPKAPVDETMVVAVTGSPAESVTNGYSLTTQLTAPLECQDDDQEPNDKKTQALILSTPSGSMSGLTLCCTVDWFYVPLKIGEGLIAKIAFDGDAQVTAQLRAPDGDEVIANATSSGQNVTVSLAQAKELGNHYLVVEGDPGTSYDVSITVTTSAGCTTSKGCGADKVCDKAVGLCVSDYCDVDADCPALPCLDTYCVDGCTYDADCRLDYRCKGFADGRYCGVYGTKPTGDACQAFSECAGAASCHFKDQGGYCTNVGCLSNAECPTDSGCVDYLDTSLCGRKCTSNGDCRQDEGYSCQPKTLPNGVPVKVCLPVP